MKKKLIAGVCLICLSIPVIASAGSRGDSVWIDSSHKIMCDLYSYSGSGTAITSWEGRESSSCPHGLYTYIEAVDQNGNRIGNGSETFNWDAGRNGTSATAAKYATSSSYMNSRHSTCSNSGNVYFQVSSY